MGIFQINESNTFQFRWARNYTKNAQSLELDMTPIMSFFMICIPYLLTMAVVTNLSVIEFFLPSPYSALTNKPGTPGTDTLELSAEITETGFKFVGVNTLLGIVYKKGTSYQYEVFMDILKAIKQQYPNQRSIVLAFSVKVLYDDVVRFMDICRESDFDDIALTGEMQ